jgi:Na+/melibiose symporter-like transporter
MLMVPGNIFLANFLSGPVGLRETLFGVIAALPAWANALQALLLPALAKRWSMRTLNLVPGLMAAVIWCGFAIALPFLPYGEARRISQLVFLILMGLSVAQAITGVAWTAWIQDWIPTRARARYFGKRNQLLGLVTVAFTGAGGVLLEMTNDSLLGYQLIFLLAGIGRLLSMAIQARVRDEPVEEQSSPSALEPSASALGLRQPRLRDDRDFVYFVAFAGILTFGLNFTGPFGPGYMAHYLEFSVSKQSLLVVLANLMGALAVPRWARALDLYGHRVILAITATCWMLMDFNWAWISAETNYLLYLMWLWGGTMSVGVVLGTFNLLLRLTPPGNRSRAVSVHLAVTSILAAVAPMAAGIMLDWLQTVGWSEQGIYRLIFFLKPVIVIGSLLLLRKVREPAPARIPGIIGAFRSVRLAFTHSGHVILANANFVRPVAFQRWRRLRRLREKRRRRNGAGFSSEHSQTNQRRSR